MDSSLFESFLAVLETGTATAAADKCYISQPALSRQIRTLEERCRTPLFTRSKSGMVPTRAARQLEPVVRDLLLHWASAELAMSALVDRKIPLTLACPTMVAEQLVLPFIPESDLLVSDVLEAPSIDLFSLVSERRVDLAFAPLLPPPGIPSKRVFRIPFLVLIPRDSDLAQRSSIDIRELPDLELIVTDRTSGTRLELDRILALSGVQVKYRHEVSRTRIGEALALSGRGQVISIDRAEFDLAEVPLLDRGRPIFVEEWAAWPSDHYAEEQVRSFISKFTTWVRSRPEYADIVIG